MRQWSVFLPVAFVALNLFAADELPLPDPNEPMEIEPPLLIGNRAADGSIVVNKSAAEVPGEVDIAKLEADLARAQKSAVTGERLFRGGIIAKVEAEERALKVIRFEAKLTEARLRESKRHANGEITEGVVSAEAAAAHAAEARRHAELEAALRNLQRQQKLLALGSGRKADVNRAEQKLVELQRLPQ
ncbi:MAG: hypothetical protein M3Z22_05110 [Verrucomicrobiota bacterium]|nr:hypothetical protein [Verrucomicrobiota bacterium]